MSRLSGAPTAQLREDWTGSLLFDHSDWGRLHMKGSPGLEYLHNQSTQDLKALKPGQGAETVFVTPTAGILDLTTVYVGEENCWVWTSPQRRSPLIQSLGRMLPFVRGAQLSDETEQTFGFVLLGSESKSVLQGLMGSEQIPNEQYEHRQVELEGIRVHLACGTGLTQQGFRLWGELSGKAPLQECLLQAGAELGGAEQWEQLRLEAGRPAADRELTADYNPLEAGLWRAISLSKGCYIGQEVLAKQVTYKRIRQTLWGIHLRGTAEPGSEIWHGEDKIGSLTSVGLTSKGYIGLGYIRTKFEPKEGLEVQVGLVHGTLVPMPFLTYPPSL
ncbi:YgfZ/GcvT domain-containing protein [Thermostichus vulcanus]|uniref:Folate-binding protein YgfZ n=1 Tax=Thermostichus vulcanus str. 'Rupite' TaxID=2813851 RepID=A0ABT0CCH8_THEVL|nr:folate-binding protein [Thermostichus vulcanus]MCJ2543470.1 folate-binding protein YgfZ [Thermostichus vulcanus str. 'Rupite']